MEIRIPIKILDIEEEGFHIFIEATINGKPANILIDTGASRTVFDKKRFSYFVPDETFELNTKLSTGLGTNTMESHRTIVKKFAIGVLELNNFQTVLLDMTHVNVSYENLEMSPIDGVFGGDLLVKHKAVIDYGNRELILQV